MEKAISEGKELAKNIDPYVNVQNPHIHLNNPNINVPASAGTRIGMAGAVTAGIYALANSKKAAAIPVGAKAPTVVLGGMLGGGAFVAVNYMNTYVEKGLNKPNNKGNINTNGDDPYSSASSIIEEGDSVNNIIYFLYFNFILSFSILSVSLLLIYLYINKNKSRLINWIWLGLTLMSLLSIYLAYNLSNDIGTISSIYLNTNYLTVIANNGMYTNEV